MTEQMATPSEARTAPVGFRPIQYLGSKVRMLDRISTALDAVNPSRGRTVDLFSGSGVVAARLAHARPTIAVDIQEYARVLAAALMSPAQMTSRGITAIVANSRSRTEELMGGRLAQLMDLEHDAVDAFERGEPLGLCHILEWGSPAAFQTGERPDDAPELVERLGLVAPMLEALGLSATLTQHYGGVYFSYRQAIELDCLLETVRDLPAGAARETALAATLGVASEIVTSVGNHFAQPVRPRSKHGEPKPGVLRAAIQRRKQGTFDIFFERMTEYANLPRQMHEATAIRDDFRSFLENCHGEIGAVYADPPYTRDHYSRFYHVLETMARGDSPEITTVSSTDPTLSRGLYRRDRHQSPFCIRTKAPAAFSSLFAGVKALGSPLIVSYSPYSTGTAARPQPRLLTIPEVIAIASEHFARIDLMSGGDISHSRFNARHLNGEINREAEQLIVCRP